MIKCEVEQYLTSEFVQTQATSHTGSQVASANAYIAISSPIEIWQARLQQIESA